MCLTAWIMVLLVLLYVPPALFPAFERTDQSSDAVKTAEACTSRFGNISALYYNPAGLAGLERKEVNFQYSRILAGLENDDLNYLNLMLGFPLRNLKLAGSFNTFSARIYSEQVFSLAGACDLFGFWGRRISLGVRMKFLKIGYSENEYTELDRIFITGGYSRSAFGADAGLLAYAKEGLSAGLSVKDINSPDLTLGGAGKGRIPVLSIGVSWRHVLKKEIMAMREILFETDIRTREDGFSVLTGIESSFFHDALIPGLGWGMGTDRQRFLTAGFSYQLKIEGINYRLRLIDYIIRFTYSFRFDFSGMSVGTWGDHFISASFMF